MTVVAFVGLGSNQGDPLRQVSTAIDELQALSCSPVRVSPMYGSKAIGPGTQPDYVNAVVRLSTALPADDMLSALHDIEHVHRRVRDQRWAARTLDLDLLVYGTAVIDQPGLQIPHPRLAERPFVLYPLFDLAPDLHIPGLGSVQTLRRQCPGDGIWPLQND
ncbi:MAG: 2-amino-4-hydroxy-6-hydroxymethyldihydropteridine diphosphokinase [Gammaproteobacteria bacterium]|nr:2-amino-4-hydroxy-6-hydroxymethyldihydropteridine diphosphokinase [Gammaproteobacteria bacterium]